MTKRPIRRLKALGAGGVLVVIIAAAIFLFDQSAESEPSLRDAMGDWKPYENLSSEFNETRRWLKDEMPDRSPWDREDAERVAALAKTRYLHQPGSGVEDPASLSEEEYDRRAAELMFNQTSAANLASSALRVDHPMSEEAKAILEQTLLDMLESPDVFMRLKGVQLVVMSRMVDDPAIRKRVEALFDDSSPRVAANAKRQLRHYDRLERARERRRPR